MNARPTVLATDLDGTLIPLDEAADNGADLTKLAEFLEDRDVTLAFVTGRHFASVVDAMEQHRLPKPDWIVCDVGTSIYRQIDGRFEYLDQYAQHQDQIITSLPIDDLREQLAPIEGLRLQEAAKQGRFKLSFYADARRLPELVQQVAERLTALDAPYNIIDSVDPFNGDGLVDLLPAQVSKAHALAWWSRHIDRDPQSIVFAGDSGNDLAALTAGYRAIVVGNADPAIASTAREAHRQAGWEDRLFVADRPATSGVLQGCQWFWD